MRGEIESALWQYPRTNFKNLLSHFHTSLPANQEQFIDKHKKVGNCFSSSIYCFHSDYYCRCGTILSLDLPLLITSNEWAPNTSTWVRKSYHARATSILFLYKHRRYYRLFRFKLFCRFHGPFQVETRSKRARTVCVKEVRGECNDHYQGRSNCRQTLRTNGQYGQCDNAQWMAI